MRNLTFKVLTVAAAATIVFGCNNSAKKAAAAAAAEQARQDSIAATKKIKETKEKKAMELMKKLPEEPEFDIVTSMGTITVKLYSKTPKHRDNFEKLALTGFYDGLLFHRVINGFMIQGGDPLTKDPQQVARYGQGGPGYTVPAEFVKEYTHKKGALAAARKGDVANPMKESSGSQFYIVQNEKACAQLDGGYTVYGETIKGLDIIDRIAQVATDNRDKPVMDVRIETIKPSGKTAEIARENGWRDVVRVNK